MPAIAPLLRATVGFTQPANGYAAFSRPCKKIVLEYCDQWGSNDGMRRFVASSKSGVQELARRNPSVEFVVKKRPFKHPILRGLYLNNRDKVICVRSLEPAQISQKIQLLLDSSGAKLRKEKGHPVESSTPSVRGIFSPFHTPWKGASNLGPLR